MTIESFAQIFWDSSDKTSGSVRLVGEYCGKVWKLPDGKWVGRHGDASIEPTVSIEMAALELAAITLQEGILRIADRVKLAANTLEGK